MKRYSSEYIKKMLSDFAVDAKLDADKRMELAKIHNHGVCYGREEMKKELKNK
jgi:hypothetical protein